MKILNGYAGIGGNRKLWGDEHDITAVELNPEIAAIYQEFFPNDTVIVADAHQYLLEHYMEFDFIWMSPECQTHSQIRFNIGFKAERKYKKVDAVYPDMRLYQEIILLKYWFDGLFTVENTKAYFITPITPSVIGDHYIWANFPITQQIQNTENRNHRNGTVETLQDRKMVDLTGCNIKNKRQILRNCVEPEIGLHILNCALGVKPIKTQQTEIEF